MGEHAGVRESLVEKLEEKLEEKVLEKIHGHDSSSSSDSDDQESSITDTVKSKIYRLFGREKPVHKVLGGGKPADLLLWKNKKASASVLGGATALWVLFELLEYHLITLLCHISILFLAILFLWANLSTFIYKSPPQIPEVRVSENCVLEVASAVRSELNRGLTVLWGITSIRDMKKFLGVIAGLWVLSVVGNCFNFLTTVYISTVLLLTVPAFYEKYEDRVDLFGEKVIAEFNKQFAVIEEQILSKIPKGLLRDYKRD